jgi:ABC-2 type transport system ATP-binding protein
MIRAAGLAKRFRQRAGLGGVTERVAIEGISFEVKAGEVFGLLGPNGGGKTTTMRLLAGLLRPSSGVATVGGRNLASDGEARRLLGFLTEQPGLYDRMTAFDNLLFSARLYELPKSQARRAVAETLERFDLADRARERVGTFSKGMRQRLALARALLHRPPALLLDEPTSGLDPEAAASVRRIIVEEARRGAAVVVSTHNLAEAEKLCPRVAIVKNRLLSVVDDRTAALQRAVVRVRGVPPNLGSRLADVAGIGAIIVRETEVEFAVGAAETIADVVQLLVAEGARIDEVTRHRRPLEERYLEAVGARSDAEGAAG